MITLAEATTFQTLALQFSEITGGKDGLNSKNPAWLSSSFEPFETEVLGLLPERFL
jgi:branched-chain amino acid transport system permease protein